MTLFANYNPTRHGQPESCATVRRARFEDVETLSAILAERGPAEHEECRRRFRLELGADDPCNAVWVVEVSGVVAGFARARELERPTDAAANHQPAGWYLGGVVIAQEFRRRGLAHRLTKARLKFLEALGAREVFYVANSVNRASIDLHTIFGFEELTRDFHAPRITFTDGQGILFRKSL